jgi:hypothetical protein
MLAAKLLLVLQKVEVAAGCGHEKQMKLLRTDPPAPAPAIRAGATTRRRDHTSDWKPFGRGTRLLLAAVKGVY